MCGLPKGANEDNQEKGVRHKMMIRRIDWEESEDATPAQLRDSSEVVD